MPSACSGLLVEGSCAPTLRTCEGVFQFFLVLHVLHDISVGGVWLLGPDLLAVRMPFSFPHDSTYGELIG